MTPVQRAGFKVGDKFRILESICGFTKGQIVTLNRDDGSSSPMFKGENSRYTLADRMTAQGAYLGLDRVELVVEPKFNIGDRVKVVNTYGRGFERGRRGKTGVITQTDSTSLPVHVRFEDGEDDWGKFEELELSVELDTATVKQKLAQIAKLTAEVQELLG